MEACCAAGAGNAAAAALPSRRCEPSTHRRFTISCRTRPHILSAQKRQRRTSIGPKQLSPTTKPLLRTVDNGQFPNTTSRTWKRPPQQSSSSEHAKSVAEMKQKDEIVAANSIEHPEKSEDGNFGSNFRLEDLGEMIQNMEKNILLLNQAHVLAVKEVDKVLNEKEALKKEVNILETKLSKIFPTEANRDTDILGDHLEKLTKEMILEGALFGGNPEFRSEPPLVMELSALKEENLVLKADAQFLKTMLAEIAETGDCLFKLEKERSLLDATVRELESRFVVAQSVMWKLAPLQYDVWMEKAETLQGMLGHLADLVEQAAAFLDQNMDLQDKVGTLEASLGDGNTSEFSPCVVELLHQKMKAAKGHLLACYEDSNTQIQVYRQLIKEFQKFLGKITEESERLSVEHSANSKPSEFWSHVLLMIDGWFLERKISYTDANILREMAWKRDDRLCKAYLACSGFKESGMMENFLKLTLSRNSPGLHIVHIAAEMAPVAKVGGLADVVSGLSKALQEKGHLVEIILPKYDCMQHDQINNLKVLDVVVQSHFEGNLYNNNIWTGTVEGLPVYLIEPQHPSKFFWRAQYYGEYDDFKRYSYFSRAALELLYQSGKKIDIIHCHDWQTAFVAPLYWDIYATRGFNSARICFTCHNFEYQGTAPTPDLAYCGLAIERLDRPDRMRDSAHGRINVAKGGIVYSNIVTTVSPTYALEVRSEGGRGLQDTIRVHSRKFVGILNGIDIETWNPSTDRFLKVHYSADDLQGKVANKAALRQQLGLCSGDDSQPLVCCITRLVPQKGLHLIRHAIYKTIELGGQFVLLGSSPVPHIQREFEAVANHFQENDNVQLILKYDEALSHCIYAASGMFIVPSVFETCGLTQMIAMRYGSVPIVRKTGGLSDNVFDLDDETVPMELFIEYTPKRISFFIEKENGSS